MRGNRSILAIIAKTCASTARRRGNLSNAASTGMLRIAAWWFPIRLADLMLLRLTDRH
jgi:hypothetical protein